MFIQDQSGRNQMKIRTLRVEIQNLQYDRDLIFQESKTISGLFKKNALNDKLKAIDNKIKELRAQLKKAEEHQLKELSKPLADPSLNLHIQTPAIAINTVENLQTEKLNMTKINVKIGDKNTIHTIAIAGESIQKSFNQADSANISDDLKSLLKELAIAVGKMSERLPDDAADQVAKDLKYLTDEATSTSPQQKWWQVSIESLKQAAKNLGEIGKPVLDLVAKIVPILLAISA